MRKSSLLSPHHACAYVRVRRSLREEGGGGGYVQLSWSAPRRPGHRPFTVGCGRGRGTPFSRARPRSAVDVLPVGQRTSSLHSIRPPQHPWSGKVRSLQLKVDSQPSVSRPYVRRSRDRRPIAAQRFAGEKDRWTTDCCESLSTDRPKKKQTDDRLTDGRATDGYKGNDSLRVTKAHASSAQSPLRARLRTACRRPIVRDTRISRKDFTASCTSQNFSSMTCTLDSSVLCILERRLFVHWLLPHNWQFWDSQGVSLECGARVRGRDKREITERTRRPAASSGKIPICESLVTRPGIEHGSPWWEASVLIAQPPRPQSKYKSSLVCSLAVSVKAEGPDRRLAVDPASLADDGCSHVLPAASSCQQITPSPSWVRVSVHRNSVLGSPGFQQSGVVVTSAREEPTPPPPPPLMTSCDFTSTLASHQDEPRSIPGRVTGFSQGGIVPDDAVGSAGLLGDLPFPPHLHSGAAPFSLKSPSSALKTSLLGAAQISLLTHYNRDFCLSEWTIREGELLISSCSPFVVTSNLPEAFLKFYVQTVPPPRATELTQMTRPPDGRAPDGCDGWLWVQPHSPASSAANREYVSVRRSQSDPNPVPRV
ncbi:hypothetical protein PR048_003515 [Dryococelus australis]|uniref:Uncharacterized protein n=1 Tax=Dryococelus australis TaxID=614101 RepID=A0ABQ9IN94_9NEOP|nr:hypothetical protein PR048_003515 [Dryococelus australis]